MKSKTLANGNLALSAKAIKLLERVKANILEEPKRFIMSSWGAKVSPKTTVYDSDARDGQSEQKAPPCGTTACIAGWVSLLGTSKRQLGFDPFEPKLSDKQLQSFDRQMGRASSDAKELLDLSGFESALLFHVANWPEPLRTKYRLSKTAKQRAKIAVARIDHFISNRE